MVLLYILVGPMSMMWCRLRFDYTTCTVIIACLINEADTDGDVQQTQIIDAYPVVV